MKKKISPTADIQWLFLLLISLVSLLQKDANAQKTRLDLPPLPTLRAVVIGVSNYKDPEIPRLHYANKDAMVFASALERVQDVQLEPITLLTEAQATYGNIFNALEGITDRSRPGDIIVFFFSGHGGLETKAGREKGYLLSYDSPRNNFRQFAFAHSELGEFLEAWVAKDIKVYLIADACHAGKIAGSKSGVPGKQLANDNLRYLAGNTDNVMEILSCQGEEESIERSDLGSGQGVFTYYLLKGLLGEADYDPKDRQLKNHEVKRYLYDSVKVNARPTMQHPLITGDDDQDFLNFPPDKRFFRTPGKAIKKPLGKSVSKEVIRSSKSVEVSVQDTLWERFESLLETGHFFMPEGENAHHYLQIIMADTALSATHNDAEGRFRAAILAENNRILQQYLNQDFEPWTTKLEDIQQGIAINLALTGMQREGSGLYEKSYANLYFFKALAWYEYSKFGNVSTRKDRLTAAQNCISIAKTHSESSAFVQLLNTLICSGLGSFPEYAILTKPEATRALFDITRECAPDWRLPYLFDGTNPSSSGNDLRSPTTDPENSAGTSDVFSTYDSLASIYLQYHDVTWYKSDSSLNGISENRWLNQAKNNPILAEDLLYTYALRYDPQNLGENQGVVNFGMASIVGNVNRQLTDGSFTPEKGRFEPGKHYSNAFQFTSPDGADQLELFAMLGSLKPYDDLPGFGKGQLADTNLDGISDQLVQETFSSAVSNLKEPEYATMGSATRDARIEAQLNQVTELLRAEKPAAAINLLESIKAKENPLYDDDREWLQALAWLIRRPANGTTLLKSIADNPLQAHQFEAKSLLFKISK